MHTKSVIYKLKTALIQCRKVKYENGEQKKFSGLMNQWRYEEWEGAWYLPYVQKYVTSVVEGEEQKKFPMFSYGCRFMVVRISVMRTDSDNNLIPRKAYQITWASGDNRIGVNFEFPPNRLEDVKKFLIFNKDVENFHTVLHNWCVSQSFEFY